jgi:hypothetical protein
MCSAWLITRSKLLTNIARKIYSITIAIKKPALVRLNITSRNRALTNEKNSSRI